MKKTDNIRHFDLKAIKDPKFLKTLSNAELEVLAADIRDEILRVTSLNGGHLSSNLGVTELTIALHKFYDFTKDKLIFDVGHQCYTHKILTGRDLSSLRKQDGISGFIKCSESPYDIFEAGHSSTSLSAASALAYIRDKEKKDYQIVTLIGDASIANGLAFEAINHLAHTSSKVIIILNDNNMSISKSVGGLGRAFGNISTGYRYNIFKAKLKRNLTKTKAGLNFLSFLARFKNFIKRSIVPLTLFDNLGFVYLGPIDGHNFKALEKAFKRANNTNKSIIIHCVTKKGKGYQLAENDHSGYWHGVTPFDISSGQPKNLHPLTISWSHFYADILKEIVKNDPRAIIISPATEKGAGLDEIFKEYPSKCIDVGIAEEHAATFASVLAKEGYHPYVSIYSTFLQRAYDMLSHDNARIKAKTKFLVERAGLIGNDGETHQGIYDVAFLTSIPNVLIAMASNKSEAKALLDYNNKTTMFIRLPREQIRKDEEILLLDIKENRYLYFNDLKMSENVLLTYGPLGRKLATYFIQNQDDIYLINTLFLSPLDEETLEQLINKKRIFIYNPYSVLEGYSDKIADYLLKHGFKGEFISYDIPLAFIKQATIPEQLKEYDLDCETIYLKIKSKIGG